MAAGYKQQRDTQGARLFREWVDYRAKASTKTYFDFCREIAVDLNTTQTTVYCWYDGRSVPAVARWAVLESYTGVPAISWSQPVERTPP